MKIEISEWERNDKAKPNKYEKGTIMSNLPQANEVWVHRVKLDKFEIVAISNAQSADFDAFPPTVTYTEISGGLTWSLPLMDFLYRFKPWSIEEDGSLSAQNQ